MKIKTITCHDVYNVGASLQAYALAEYLRQQGHDVEIVHYKPDYLSGHYSLWGVGNSRYDRPFLKELYLLAKLPGRLLAKHGKRKRDFDTFTREMLPVTEKRYTSNEELKKAPPEADVYFAGSDQIWNTFFPNGKDPAFYLDFVPENNIKASYAASFATESLPEEWKDQIKEWLSELDYISVRESSGVEICRDMGLVEAVQVLDPVFLLSDRDWLLIEKPLHLAEPYLLIYDFDRNPEMEKYVKRIAEKNNWKIYSVLGCDYADRCFTQEGPAAFLTLIRNAEFVVSNSFHATAFSLIFHKQFVVFNRNEGINTRMRDLIQLAGVQERLISDSCSDLQDINYAVVDEKIRSAIGKSKAYIEQVLGSVK